MGENPLNPSAGVPQRICSGYRYSLTQIECGKTVSTLVYYLYVYNFGTTNSKIAFLHKGADGAKDNLQSLKNLRELLPKYLIMTEKITPDGKINRGKNNMTEIVNPFNNNSIRTYSSATNKAKAASLLRGKSIPLLYFDEYGFMPFNDVVYSNMVPAFKITADFAKKNGAPFGIVITTTPGFMNDDAGRVAYEFQDEATEFSESWYDKTYTELMAIVEANTKSSFIHIKFSYSQLGRSEQWFSELVKLFRGNWSDVKREVLLEWSMAVENSPFKPEDLEALAGMIRQPINTTYLLGKYRFDTYLQADTVTYPPLIGVDVAAGYKQDSSTITVVDSLSTRVLGCMNCNYISTIDLARCIEFIVKNWMPNAIVNVERNGGYGSTVISHLIKMGLKKNLYYEIQDRIVEEKQDGVHAYKQKIRTKVYGLNSTKAIRQVLIDILIERVESHKDKIISPIIYNEIIGMEVKRNGKVEHSNTTHDDQVFSMLMALYMWYEGVNMAERFGLKKTSIRTDDDIDEQVDYYNDDTVELVGYLNNESDEVQEEIQHDLDAAIRAGGTPMQEFLDKQRAQERAQFERLVTTPIGERAYRQMYNIPDGYPVSNYVNSDPNITIPDSVFYGFYNPTDNTYRQQTAGINPAQGAVPEGQAMLLDDDEYKYTDHFNF